MPIPRIMSSSEMDALYPSNVMHCNICHWPTVGRYEETGLSLDDSVPQIPDNPEGGLRLRTCYCTFHLYAFRSSPVPACLFLIQNLRKCFLKCAIETSKSLRCPYCCASATMARGMQPTFEAAPEIMIDFVSPTCVLKDFDIFPILKEEAHFARYSWTRMPTLSSIIVPSAISPR